MKGNNIKLKQTIECNAITNLNKKKYSDEDIKKIYLSRWVVNLWFAKDIEVFF